LSPFKLVGFFELIHGCTCCRNNKDINIKHILNGLFIGLLIWSSPANSVDVVVNQSVQLQSLSTKQLRRIYSMRQVRWADGSSIQVYVLPSQHKIHQRFSKDVLRIFPYQLDRMWNKLTFSGLGVGPVEVPDEKTLLKLIAETPGSIGYVEKYSEVDDVQLIKIDE